MTRGRQAQVMNRGVPRVVSVRNRAFHIRERDVADLCQVVIRGQVIFELPLVGKAKLAAWALPHPAHHRQFECHR